MRMFFMNSWIFYTKLRALREAGSLISSASNESRQTGTLFLFLLKDIQFGPFDFHDFAL